MLNGENVDCSALNAFVLLKLSVFIQIFSFNQKPAEDDEDEDGDDDTSDSSDSVYSGLEDSGSDSDDDEEEEKQLCDDADDVKAEPKKNEQVGACTIVGGITGVSAASFTLHFAHRQWRGKEDRIMKK